MSQLGVNDFGKSGTVATAQLEREFRTSLWGSVETITILTIGKQPLTSVYLLPIPYLTLIPEQSRAHRELAHPIPFNLDLTTV